MYSFFDENDKILYVGKAKNLKNRLTSYTHYDQLSSRIQKLVTTAVRVQFEILESELEALLIEAELIRIHQPFFNIRLKDDKSPLYLVITKEEYPRVLRKRKKDLIVEKPKGTLLGPFQSSFKLEEVLKIARKIFPWCSQPLQTGDTPTKPCFYYHLDQCPGACLGLISPEAYNENIRSLILFLRGQKKEVIRELTTQMKELSGNQYYEEALIVKNRLHMIQEVTQKTYKLSPDLVLPGFGVTQQEQGIVELLKILNLYTPLPKNTKLQRIECYDVSNVQGKNAAVSMVVALNGEPTPEQYRLFNIYTLDTPNDYHMMKEALTRRQNHPEWGRPDLVVIDGGKGQVRSVLQVWQWSVPVIGIAKNPDRLVIPLYQKENTTVSLKKTAIADTKPAAQYEIITLPSNHPALKVIQQLRDEAHRFAKKQWGRRHLKKMLQ